MAARFAAASFRASWNVKKPPAFAAVRDALGQRGGESAAVNGLRERVSFAVANLFECTAASIAALTIYDMCKAVDRGMVISEVRLVHKSGGKSGHFVAEK